MTVKAQYLISMYGCINKGETIDRKEKLDEKSLINAAIPQKPSKRIFHITELSVSDTPHNNGRAKTAFTSKQ